LGIAEGWEIQAESFDFTPRQVKTNFYELNLKNKKRIKFVFSGDRSTNVELITSATLLAIPC
jgi:hypothetical protein